jgi:glycogen operon protein
VDWSEWNGRFRDTLRRFGKGDAGQVPELAARLTGSADLYRGNGRSPDNSINFITCHDGFTLADLLCYNQKHNEANLEDNRDGTDDNQSWNCGVEGETTDPAVLRLRAQLARNALCALLFAAGTPMLLGGDEVGRTQRGNNNAYCQDNALSWFDWALVERHRDLLTFTREAIAFTRRFPVLQRRRFFEGRDENANGIPDIQWSDPQGATPAWANPDLRTLCYLMDGSEDDAGRGAYALFLIWNADYRTRAVTLPTLPGSWPWHRVVDTSLPAGQDFLAPGQEVPIAPPGCYVANPRSVVVLLAR